MGKEGTPPNQYYNSAHLYDYDNKELLRDDLPFYKGYAEQTGGPILELGCGTGRLTLPLAEAGFEIDGLDLSQPMLSVFAQKLAQQSAAIQQRVRLHHANMAAFELSREYRLIFIPFRSFQSLTTSADQEGCLQCVRKHLDPTGHFIVNVFKPYGFLDDRWIDLKERIDFETLDGDTMIRRSHIRRQIDAEQQIIYPEFTYYVQKGEEVVRTYREKLMLKYYYESQLRKLLESNGFEIQDAFGYYDNRAVSEGTELIFCLYAALIKLLCPKSVQSSEKRLVHCSPPLPI